MRLLIVTLMSLVWFLLSAQGMLAAAVFGKNKLQTRAFNWQVLETDHFEIHYYPEEEKLAEEVCRYAEEAFLQDTQLLRYTPTEKTPLFLYRDQIDFQQTNITPQIIGIGTGGFTEPFKNRIALPAPTSPLLLKEVVTHEYIHALQFDMLYGEGIRSFRIYKGYLIPLWVMEGLADYAAGRWDGIDEMIIRDAVINKRLSPLMLLEGFSHLDDVYLAYKESQLAIQYLSQTYGQEKVASFFMKFKNQVSTSQILRETTGRGLEEFNRDFFYWLHQHYWAQTEGRVSLDKTGPLLDPLPKGRLVNSSGPVWSPDGRYLAFISNKDGFVKVYLKPRGDRKTAYVLKDYAFEQVVTNGRPLTWSPDSKWIAFFAQEQGRQFLYTLNVSDRTLRRWLVPLAGMSSPAWSPDGQQLLLAGVSNGVADIYTWDFGKHELTPHTHDRWADATPCWSPDGKTIVYSSERRGHWQLVKLSFPVSGEETLVTQSAADHIQPIFSPDGHKLFYSADEDGIFNLYARPWGSQASIRLTNVVSGAFQPCLNTSLQKMSFTGYENGQWGIRLLTMADPDSMPTPLNLALETSLVSQAATPTPVAAITPGPMAATGNSSPARTDQLIKARHPYHFRFTPDLLFLLAGYDSTQGLLGGGYITGSDYLGDHQVSLMSNFVPGYQAQTTLTYANYSYPIDMALVASYQKNYYRIMDLETNTLLEEYNDEEIGGGLQFSKAFSVFDRVELEYAMRFLRREQDSMVLNKRVSSLRLSLIHDHTSWLDFAPATGWRYNLSGLVADRFLGGEENYQIIQMDSQTYFNLRFIDPYMVLATRLMGALSSGPQHPLFLFGGLGVLPESLTIRGFHLGELIGSQMVTLNMELRFPLARNIHYSLWPLDFLMMKHLYLVFFDDVGIVSNNLLKIDERDVKNSIGVGFRLHTFLIGKELLTIRFDIAQRTDLPGNTVYTWGIGQSF